MLFTSDILLLCEQVKERKSDWDYMEIVVSTIIHIIIIIIYRQHDIARHHMDHYNAAELREIMEYREKEEKTKQNNKTYINH